MVRYNSLEPLLKNKGRILRTLLNCGAREGIRCSAGSKAIFCRYILPVNYEVPLT